MLNPAELETAATALDGPMHVLENAIMEDIIRRIRINGEITRAADWQIYRLHELGMSKRDIKKALAEKLHLNKKEINHLYMDVIRKGYSNDEQLYKYKGKPFIPFEENAELQQLITALSAQTFGALNNITQSLGFAVRNPDGKLVFKDIAQYYQDTLDSAVNGIASGAFDYNTAIKHAVSEMTNSGLRTVDYATGWSNRVDVAARRAVMTGITQLAGKVNENTAQALGTDMYEITWHSGARPSHQVWQGRVYSKAQLESVCGLGTAGGLCGANCYHSYYPFVEGISKRAYTDEQLDALNAADNKPREFGGKKYTKYEVLQRQRKLETTMRAERQQIKLLKDGGADEDDIINARARYRVTSAEYTRFSEQMELPQQRARVTVDGLGNIGSGKFTGGSGKPSPMDVPKVGAEVRGKVSGRERNELLKAQKSVDKSENSGIINNKSKTIHIGLQFFAVIPEEKFTKYALDPIKQPDKARAFREALGYTMENYQELIDNIQANFDESLLKLKTKDQYGQRYELIMNIQGTNGKRANVCTGWIKETDDAEPRMTSAYVTKKEVSGK